VKSFLSGFDNLATAKSSLLSLYRPTEVIYVAGVVMTSLSDEVKFLVEEIKFGWEEKLNS
jgi:hypothetical protein